MLGAAGGSWVLGRGWGAGEGERDVSMGWGGSSPHFPGCPWPRRHWGGSVGWWQCWVLPAQEHARSTSPMRIKSPGASGDLCAPPISGVPQRAAFTQPCLQPPTSHSGLLATPALVKLGLAPSAHGVRALSHSVWEQPPGLHWDPWGAEAELGTPSSNVTARGDAEFLKPEHPAPNPLQTLSWPNPSPQTGHKLGAVLLSADAGTFALGRVGAGGEERIFQLYPFLGCLGSIHNQGGAEPSGDPGLPSPCPQGVISAE